MNDKCVCVWMCVHDYVFCNAYTWHESIAARHQWLQREEGFVMHRTVVH